MANRLDKPNQLAFVRGELEMSSREQTTEEGEGTIALMQDHAEARVRHVAIHREGVGELRQLEGGGGGERAFEGVERRGLFGGLEEPFLREQLCEGRGDGTIVLNEPAVLPR